MAKTTTKSITKPVRSGATKAGRRSGTRADAGPVAASNGKRRTNPAKNTSTTKAASSAAARTVRGDAAGRKQVETTTPAVGAPKKPAASKAAAKKTTPKTAAAATKKAPSRKTVDDSLIEIELVDDSETPVRRSRPAKNVEVSEADDVVESDDLAIEDIEIDEAEIVEVPEIIDYNDRNTVLFTERNRIKADLERALAVPERRRSAVQQRRLSRLLRDLDDITTQIVKFNYGLVRSYTKKFTSNSSREDSADFEASAVVGLMRAIDSFDPTKGRFGAWAYKPIQREVLRAVRDADFKSMNPGDFERRPDILRAVAKLQAGDDTRMPSNAAIAAEARVTVDQVRRVLEAPHLESIHQHVGDDGGTELGDLIESDTTRVEGAVLSSMTLTALEDYGFRALDDRELFVLVRRFGLDSEPEQKLASIGDMLGLSREAVRQVESKALAKLMHPTILRRIVRYGRA